MIDQRIDVGVLGATGMVGQTFVRLLAGHPWFNLTWLAASERSAGRTYARAAAWRLPVPMPREIAGAPVHACTPGEGPRWCRRCRRCRGPATRDMAMLSAVGDNLCHDPGIAPRVSAARDGFAVRMVSQSASRRNVTVVLPDGEVAAGWRGCTTRFFRKFGVGRSPEASFARPKDIAGSVDLSRSRQAQ